MKVSSSDIAQQNPVGPPLPNSAQQWNDLIDDAIATADPVLSNFKITRLHFLLSQALQQAIGPTAGANFHSWAVWGSRKAGITIRQEDKDQASRDATVVAGIVGAIVGIGVGWLAAYLFGWSLLLSIVIWAIIGALTGGYCGFLLAGYTRHEAARLILEGNRIVLDDIGRATARYLEFVSMAADDSEQRDRAFEEFIGGFRTGKTDSGGQKLLGRAFGQYEAARRSTDQKVRHESTYFANCLAILHEHIRLQPYIGRSLPFLIRKCVTQRLMTYSVGQVELSVHDAVPPLGEMDFPQTLSSIEAPELKAFLHGPTGWDRARGRLENTRAIDWTRLHERMNYVVNLFRTRHLAADVVASPYSATQLQSIADQTIPDRPW